MQLGVDKLPQGLGKTAYSHVMKTVTLLGDAVDVSLLSLLSPVRGACPLVLFLTLAARWMITATLSRMLRCLSSEVWKLSRCVSAALRALRLDIQFVSPH